MSRSDTHVAAFAAALRDLRERRGYSLSQLGERAGLPKNTVARLERGEFQPGWGIACRLADALGVSVARFRT